METYYELVVECATEEIVYNIQRFINSNYNSEEVYWNGYREKHQA